MIEINEQFDVPSAQPRVVWDLLSDPHAVVGCVPGAALGDEHEDGSFDGSLTVKFGPARVTFRARIELELNAETMVGRVTSRGKDNQGGTRFRAAMKFRVEEQADPPGSKVLITGENEISGKLAGLVEAGAKIVIKRMSADFAENLAARVAEGNPQGEKP
jgi:carbon monoxide dehydrogenase subunit G